MDIDIQYPLTALPSGRLRRLAKVSMGFLFGWLFPRRRCELLAGAVGDRLDFRDRAMLASLVWLHERNGTLDRLAALQQWLWRGPQAVAFHAQAEARFQAWWVEGASRVLVPLQDLLQREPQTFTTLCEIGCGSGLVLQDLSNRLPDLAGLVGLDLSPEQMVRNRVRFSDQPRLRFEAADATEWIPAHGAPGWIYLTNAGVLEYLSEASVRTLFLRIASSLAPAVFVLVEPVADDFDIDAAPHSRPFSRERTFSHPYPKLLREAGWQVIWSEIGRIADGRFAMVVARTA